MSQDTALLLIDAQIGLLADFDNPAYQSQRVLANMAVLLERARAYHTPIIYMQHESGSGTRMAPGSRNWKIHPLIPPLEGELVIPKRASDSFYQTSLQDELAARRIKHLVITGCRTEMCIDTTCRVAISRGYEVTLVKDAHTTVDNPVLKAEQIIEHHNYTLDDFGTDEHAIVISSAREISF